MQTDSDEARWIVRRIQQFVAAEQHTLEQCAILYRTKKLVHRKRLPAAQAGLGCGLCRLRMLLGWALCGSQLKRPPCLVCILQKNLISKQLTEAGIAFRVRAVVADLKPFV